MAETDWFNKPVENSRELILKEAFKLFLQKNVEKVTVPELERVTKLQRGAIFYHFKDKSTIFEEVIERYFFSSLNILYPISPDRIYSLKEYWDRKHQRLNTIRDWFKQESISIHPCAAFFHLAEQANLYIPTFKEDMKNLMRMEKEYWIRVAHLDSELKGTNDNACFWGEIWKNVFLAKCYEACYEKEDIFIDDFNEIGIIRP